MLESGDFEIDSPMGEALPTATSTHCHKILSKQPTFSYLQFYRSSCNLGNDIIKSDFKRKIMKNSRFLFALSSIIFIPTLFLSTTIKVSACHKWNPFCSDKPQGIIIKSPAPKGHPISPEDGGQNWILVGTRMYLSSSFTPEERNFMSEILTRFDDRTSDAYSSSFVACTANYTNADTPDNAMLNRLSVNSIFSQLRSRKFIYVQKITNPKELEDNPLARASLGLETDYFSMKINPAVTTLDKERMAGTLVHEMLHNLGYSHSRYSKTKDDADRLGNFVYEAGWCVAREYSDKPRGTLGLTDPSNYHVD